MARPARKSREQGLFKYCAHLWDRCECPWLGRYRSVRYINLAEWGGVPSVSKTRAKELLNDAKIAIRAGTFRKEGKVEDPKKLAATLTFSDFIKKYRTYLTDERGIKESPNNALHSYLTMIQRSHGEKLLGDMLHSWVWEEEILKGKSPATHNRYAAYAHAMFEWGMQPKTSLVKSNPLDEVETKTEIRRKPVRLNDGGVTEEELFAAVATAYPTDTPHTKLNALNARRQRAMTWRIVAALDTGLRAKELAEIQLKHVNFKTWKITLPTSKGFTKTGEQEHVYAMTPRLQAILESRRFIGAEGYVFGKEDGKKQKGWRKAWRAIFTAAGLEIGQGKFVWHSLRHEFISQMAELTDNVQEVKELARHRNIQTTEGYMKAREERLKELLRRKVQA